MKVKSVVKQYTCCKKILPIEEFYKHKGAKGRYRPICKNCQNYLSKKTHNKEMVSKLVEMLEPIRNGDITTKELRKIKQLKVKGACHESKN